MDIGDTVVRKSYDKDIIFKIIDIKEIKGKPTYILKGVSIRIIADSPKDDLESVDMGYIEEKEKILNSRVSDAIKKAMNTRGDMYARSEINSRSAKNQKIQDPNKELVFGRPGKILHIDGEEVKPDIVVLTGHDSVLKRTDNYLDLENYRNSKYYIEAVKALRNYNSSYDELVIFAGACQSCYECLLDAGANFASSPSRVLIHCLDPVFVCEKIAYSRIDTIVSITDVIEGTITGIRGIGGLQTRGKYREGYPRSTYI